MLILSALVVAYLIGTLPLGSLLIKWATGREARAFNAYNLGVENLLYFVGAPVALFSFFLDMCKGFLAVALFGGSGWAALGVYLGHLYPLRLLPELPRGRGNGVLLGVLAAWWAYGTLPWVVTALVVATYVGVLATTRFVALATLGSLGVLVVSVVGSSPLLPPTFLILAVALWRHKVSLARIADKTEARLGEPPAVHGRDPNTVLAAFMIHPIALEDLWQPRSQRWSELLAKVAPVALLRRATLKMRPQVVDEMTGIYLRDGRELRVLLIGGPLLPEQIRRYPKVATRMAVQGARLAQERGAEAFGLGAFWSTVGNKGLEVQEAVPDIAITNGGAYTAATVKAAVPGLLKAFEQEGGTLRRATAAVVGANGVVAFGVARSIAGNVAEVILVGRDLERVTRSAETLQRKYPNTRITATTDIGMCSRADLVFTATSDPDSVLYKNHVKPGAWLFDLGRPADVDVSVLSVPGVHIVPGGVVKPPGNMQSFIDIHFGDGLVPACMAETMIMTATHAFERKSLGPSTKSANIDFYLKEGERLGFEIVTRDERMTRPAEVA